MGTVLGIAGTATGDSDVSITGFPLGGRDGAKEEKVGMTEGDRKGLSVDPTVLGLKLGTMVGTRVGTDVKVFGVTEGIREIEGIAEMKSAF